MHVSASGRALIERFEGLRLVAYQDVVGVWTIGYGCTGPNIHRGMTITKAQADQMLSDRLANEFEPGVVEAIAGTPTTQNQFDAMCCLEFNIGVGRPLAHKLGPAGFLGSSVARFHRLRNYAAAADAFLLWNKAGGRVLPALSQRRAVERALYHDGVSPILRNDPPSNEAPKSNAADETEITRRLNRQEFDRHR